MAHFAKLDDQNIVIRVSFVENKNILDSNGNESDAKGIEFLKARFGHGTKWAQTSYNGNIRKNYAGKGYTFDPARDAFIPPRPFLSWNLNDETCLWEPPIPYPADGSISKVYFWNETEGAWELKN